MYTALKGLILLDNITIGEFIKAKRIEKNMSVRDFDKQGFSKAKLSLIENGVRTPKADTLQEIAKILEINVIELYQVAGYLTDEEVKDYYSKLDK